MQIDESTTTYLLMHEIKKITHIKKHPEMEGLKHNEFHVLMHVSKSVCEKKEGIKTSELAESMRVAPPTVTLALNRLEKDGYITRRIDENDRRAVRVNITDRGLAIIDKASENIYHSLNGLVSYLGEEESKQFLTTLQKVYQYYTENETRR